MTDEPKCKTCGDTREVCVSQDEDQNEVWMPCPDCNPEAIRWAGTEAPRPFAEEGDWIIPEAPSEPEGTPEENPLAWGGIDWPKEAPSGAEGEAQSSLGHSSAVSGASPSALDQIEQSLVDADPEEALRIVRGLKATGQATQGNKDE